MQQRHCRVDGPDLQLLVLVGHSHRFAVQRESELPFNHVQANAQSALFLESLTVGWPGRVAIVAELLSSQQLYLAQAVIGPAVFKIAKCRVVVEVSLRRHANFQLILCPVIGLNLPVVDAAHEAVRRDGAPEHVGSFFKKDPGVVVLNVNPAAHALLVPFEGDDLSGNRKRRL